MMKKLSGKETFHLRWWFLIVGSRKFKKVNAKNVKTQFYGIFFCLWNVHFIFHFTRYFFGLDFLTFFGPMRRNLVLQYFYYTQLNLTIFEIYWCLSIIIGTFLLYNTVWHEKNFAQFIGKALSGSETFINSRPKKPCNDIFNQFLGIFYTFSESNFFKKFVKLIYLISRFFFGLRKRN